MEVQTFGGNNYFLQYHRAADSNPSTFTLDRAIRPTEVVATFVRGATEPKGRLFKVNIDRRNFYLRKEDGGVDLHGFNIFKELMSRRRKLQLTKLNYARVIGVWSDTSHLNISQLFKGPLSIAVSDTDIHTLINGAKAPDIFSQPLVTLFVISDGEKAYLRRVGISPPKQQAVSS